MKFSFLSMTVIASVAALLCSIAPDYSYLIIGLGMATQAALGPLTDRVRPYELVRWEPNQLYTRTAGTIKNTSSGTIAAGVIDCGLPLNLNGTQWETVQAGSEATTDGLFLGDDAYGIPESLAAAAITKLKYPILFRGPALINQSKIATTDVAGAALTVATIVTALKALSPPIDMLIEPAAAAIGTQTT